MQAWLRLPRGNRIIPRVAAAPAPGSALMAAVFSAVGRRACRGNDTARPGSTIGPGTAGLARSGPISRNDGEAADHISDHPGAPLSGRPFPRSRSPCSRQGGITLSLGRRRSGASHDHAARSPDRYRIGINAARSRFRNSAILGSSMSGKGSASVTFAYLPWRTRIVVIRGPRRARNACRTSGLSSTMT